LCLDASITDFLGLLPTRAQQLLQDPFLNSIGQISADRWIYRTGAINHLAGNAIQVSGYLTDRNVVTYCAGIGHGFREGFGASGWELSCWRVPTVARPKGRGMSREFFPELAGFDPYELLGVKRNATVPDIVRTHRRLLRRLHPNLSTGDEEIAKLLNITRDVLLDTDRRAAYDHRSTTSIPPPQTFRPPPGTRMMS
jgi:hypothetical protein